MGATRVRTTKKKASVTHFDAARAAAVAAEKKERATAYGQMVGIQAAVTSSRATNMRIKRPFFPEDHVVFCPGCDFKLTRADVQAGFVEGPHNFDTTCPDCGDRFPTLDVVRSAKTTDERQFVWLCKEQTRAAYQEVLDRYGEDITFAELLRHDPHVVWNAYRYGLEEGRKGSKEYVVTGFLDHDPVSEPESD